MRPSLAGSVTVAWLCAGVFLLAMPGTARADVVDESYQAGSEAALAGDWAGAIEHFEEAQKLLPGRSAVLSHDLGVAYAHSGEWGKATYHLMRALQGETSPAVAESARHELGIVRKRAEMSAAATEAKLSPPTGWWDLLLSALAAPAVGWAALVSGWLWLAALGMRAFAPPNLRRRFGGLVWPLAFAFMFSALAHAFVGGENSPAAVVLGMKVEVKDGPGGHRARAFDLQGGAQVRILETNAGWSRIRMKGGLEGWAPTAQLGTL